MHLESTLKVRQQGNFRKLGICVHVRESPAVGQSTGTVMYVHEVIAKKLEIANRRSHGLLRRIAKHAQDIFSRNICKFVLEEVIIQEKIKHEVFVHNVRPIVILYFGKDRWAQQRVKRNNLFEVVKPRPFHVVVPADAIVGNKPLGCNKPRSHLVNTVAFEPIGCA